MESSKESLIIVEEISKKINNKTFHHHYHILYDIANTYSKNYKITYLEIGCYAGGSACLMLQRPNTDVYSIDLGYPITKKIVYNNINNLNRYNNYYEYIQGNSNSVNVINRVNKNIKKIDILFIDGDHSYNGVLSDFNIYSKYLNNGGYIVFDDYNDKLNSPEVKIAVDDIVKNLNDYELIGCLKNIYNARPKELKEGNCYIIKKWKN